MSFATMDASDISAGYASGSFSPVEVTAFLLERVDRTRNSLNAFYQITPDEALEAARQSERRWLRREPRSALDGIPTSIKDALPSKGHRSYRGSAAHPVVVAPSKLDAPVVARMREAGMVFLGKTTMPDFGILAGSVSSKHGVTRNPWNLDHTAGGSSAGVASSIAAGLNPVAVGTDIVGSIRLPASFCGIFGFKPSQGRVPYYFPNSPSLVAGPMSRTVRDAALLMNVIAKPDLCDFTALPPSDVDYTKVLDLPPRSNAHIGVIENLGFGVETDPEVLRIFRAAIDRLRGHYDLIEVKADFTADHMKAAEFFYKARCRSEFRKFPVEMQRRAETIAAWSSEADAASAADFYEAFNQLQLMREKAARLIDGCAFLVLPTVARPAFDAEIPGYSATELFQPWLNTFLFNLTEQPGSSVPSGLTSGGLPVGLQIIGERFDDVGVFQFSGQLEQLFPWREPLSRIIEKF